MKKMIQKGFTLIEIMVVVALVAVLTSIAIPAYNDYVLKSRVSQLVAAANQAKAGVSELAQAREALTAIDELTGPPVVGMISALSINGSGVITVGGKDEVAPGGFGTAVQLVMVPSWNNTAKAVRWSCSLSPAKFEPSNCKTD